MPGATTQPFQFMPPPAPPPPIRQPYPGYHSCETSGVPQVGNPWYREIKWRSIEGPRIIFRPATLRPPPLSVNLSNSPNYNFVILHIKSNKPVKVLLLFNSRVKTYWKESKVEPKILRPRLKSTRLVQKYFLCVTENHLISFNCWKFSRWFLRKIEKKENNNLKSTKLKLFISILWLKFLLL